MGDTMPHKVPDNAPDKANVLLPPPLIFLAALVVGLLLQYVLPIDWLPASWADWIGGVLVGIAVAIGLSGVLALRAARTAIDPHKPTTAIVQAGPYGFSRNPLYVSLILLCAGIAALSNALWILVMLIPAILVLRVGVIRREETYLDRKFGDEYRAYRARVRRWI
jgi:protein-S-isoprenylcysteine O-methyltransferase Ste14